MIISSYHHHITRPSWSGWAPPTVSRFWPKGQEKNENRPFYPSAKSCRELKLSSSGVIFQDGAANNAQKFIAPPKQLVLDLTLHLHGDFLLRKFHPNFFVGVKKWNVGDRLKRVLAKFEANRSYPRGVNGRSKFRKLPAIILVNIFDGKNISGSVGGSFRQIYLI